MLRCPRAFGSPNCLNFRYRSGKVAGIVQMLTAVGRHPSLLQSTIEVTVMSIPLAFFNLGAQEMIILLIIGVLLFGRKLPEVGRYLGKGIVEFKKGIKGLEDEFDPSTVAARPETPALEQPRPPQRMVTTAPKFEDSPANITTPP